MDDVTRQRLRKSMAIWGDEIASAINVAAESQLAAEDAQLDLLDKLKGSVGGDMVAILREQVQGLGVDPDEHIPPESWETIINQFTEALATALIENAIAGLIDDDGDNERTDS